MIDRLYFDPAPAERKSSPLDETVSNAKSLDEIGDEFRLIRYDFMHRFRQEIRKK